MDIHGWIGDFARQAIESGDRERYQLVSVTSEALPLVGKDPDRALTLLEQGRVLAEGLDEPWFVRFFEHWMIQALLFHKRDPRTALPMAQTAVKETSAAGYEDFPQRICLREDLIFSLLHRDPQGYAAQIEEALEYMQAEITPDCPCLHCLHEIRTAYPLALGRLDEAEQAALEAVRLAWPASDYHHVLIAFTALCQIAYQREDWPKLKHWSGMGETFAGQGVAEPYVRELLTWQAAALRRLGDTETAAEKYRHVRRQVRGVPSTPTPGYFDALYAYHEADARRTLAVCDLELSGLAGHGEVMRECRVRLRRFRLLSLLGRGERAREEEATLRALAATLADPKPVLEVLERRG